MILLTEQGTAVEVRVGGHHSHQGPRSRSQQLHNKTRGPAKLGVSGQPVGYTRARKRSYRRAVQRAGQHGYTWYRGQCLSLRHLCSEYVSNDHQGQVVRSSRSHEQKIDNNHVPFHVLSYNCGGLSTIKDELFTWISDANLHAVFLQETWMLGELDYESRGWLCVNSGLKEAKRAHAGVMTLVRANFVDRDTLRFHHVIPGHLLHVQVRSKGGWLSLLNIYQVLLGTGDGRSGNE